MAKRTDVHRPSEMNPLDYVVLAVGEVDFEENPETGRVTRFLRLFEENPRWTELGEPEDSTWSGHRDDQCDHCGARVKYFSVVEHRPTGDIITVGLRCTSRFFNVNFNHKISMMKAAAEKRRKFKALFEQHPGLEEALALCNDAAHRVSKVACKIAGKVAHYAKATDKQVAVLMAEAVKIRAWKAELESKLKSMEPIQPGRYVLRGRVLRLKDDEMRDDFGPRPTHKVIGFRYAANIDLEDGRKVWAKLPRELHPCGYVHSLNECFRECWGSQGVYEGDLIEFKASVTVSDTDPFFGYAKNVRTFKVLEKGSAWPEEEPVSPPMTPIPGYGQPNGRGSF